MANSALNKLKSKVNTKTLVGKQKNLDMNKNGKLDKEDFKILRGDKMAEGGEVKSKEDIKKILDELGIKNYTINDDLTVDVDGNVSIISKELTKIPVKFGKVNGNFVLLHNKLITLKNCPEEVQGNFICHDNQFTTLKGGPKIVNGNYMCEHSKLITLEGCPEEIKGYFNCDYNKLKTLKGGPKKVNDDFNCSDNELTSLKDSPKQVRGSFYCVNNKLTSLEGCPEKINYDFYCYNNKLTSLKGGPKIVKGNYYAHGNMLENLEGGPIKVGKKFQFELEEKMAKGGEMREFIDWDKIIGKKINGWEATDNNGISILWENDKSDYSFFATPGWENEQNLPIQIIGGEDSGFGAAMFSRNKDASYELNDYLMEVKEIIRIINSKKTLNASDFKNSFSNVINNGDSFAKGGYMDDGGELRNVFEIKLKNPNEAMNQRQEIRSMKDLKAHSKQAYESLIELWASLSRVTNASAQKYLSRDMGYRFEIFVDGNNIQFKDKHAGDKFLWDGEKWKSNYMANGGEIYDKDLFKKELAEFKKEIKEGYGWISPDYVIDSWENMGFETNVSDFKSQAAQDLFKNLIDSGLLYHEEYEGNEEQGEKIESFRELYGFNYGDKYAKGGYMAEGGEVDKKIKLPLIYFRKGSKVKISEIEPKLIRDAIKAAKEYNTDLKIYFNKEAINFYYSPNKMNPDDLLAADVSINGEVNRYGGNVKVVKIGSRTFYLTYIDKNHYYVSRSPEYLGKVYYFNHIFPKRTNEIWLNEEVINWMLSHRAEYEYAKGGYMADGGELTSNDYLIDIHDFKGDKDSAYVWLKEGFYSTGIEDKVEVEYPKKDNFIRVRLNSDDEKDKDEMLGILIDMEVTYIPGDDNSFDKRDYYAEGGSLAEQNNDMLQSTITEMKHHVDELKSVVSNNTEVEPWVIAKAERASTDLSDITHYLEGEKQKGLKMPFEKGGYMTEGGETEDDKNKIAQDLRKTLDKAFLLVMKLFPENQEEFDKLPYWTKNNLIECRKGITTAMGHQVYQFEDGGYMAAGGMTAGRYYKDNSGKELRYIGESQGKLLFKDGEKIVEREESDFEDSPKENKLFGFFKEGGEIKNQYENLTPKEIWSMWTEKQRMHFIRDHRHEFPEIMDSGFILAKKDFGKLPARVQIAVEFHTEDGEYAMGGRLSSDVMQRMNELVILTTKKEFKKAAAVLRADFTEEGFENDEIDKYLCHLVSNSYAKGGQIDSEKYEAVQVINQLKSAVATSSNIDTDTKVFIDGRLSNVMRLVDKAYAGLEENETITKLYFYIDSATESIDEIQKELVSSKSQTSIESDYIAKKLEDLYDLVSNMGFNIEMENEG